MCAVAVDAEHERLDQEIDDARDQARRGEAERHRLRAERRRLLDRQAYLKAKRAKLKKQVAKLTARAARLGLIDEATEAESEGD